MKKTVIVLFCILCASCSKRDEVRGVVSAFVDRCAPQSIQYQINTASSPRTFTIACEEEFK